MFPIVVSLRIMLWNILRTLGTHWEVTETWWEHYENIFRTWQEHFGNIEIQKYQNINKINPWNYSQQKAKNGLGLNSKPKVLLKVGPRCQPQVWRLGQGDTLTNCKGTNSHPKKKTTNFHDENKLKQLVKMFSCFESFWSKTKKCLHQKMV